MACLGPEVKHFQMSTLFRFPSIRVTPSAGTKQFYTRPMMVLIARSKGLYDSSQPLRNRSGKVVWIKAIAWSTLDLHAHNFRQHAAQSFLPVREYMNWEIFFLFRNAFHLSFF
jgi:hypothetical protein